MSFINVFTTTRVRTVVRSAVAAAVGSLVSWGAVKWGNFNSGTFAVLAPTVASAYFALVHWLENKFPKLGWLLGLLPAATPVLVVPPVAPTPAPTPTPAPAAKATKPVKKAVKKKA